MVLYLHNINKMNKLLIFIFLFFLNNLQAQKYCNPIDLKMLLSGTFGELRTNHFHAGIDLKTNGVIGHNIYSIDDGYVSRIKVSSWGYGKAIYINHKNGKTSVYAHLKEFSGKIDSIIKLQQYKNESFEIDYYLPHKKLKIQKCEKIALSGNSGSSFGPHLHFEIRETKNQIPINPLSEGINIEDDIPPYINGLKLYSINNAIIDNEKNDKILKLNLINGKYKTKEIPVIKGDFGIGISTFDRSNNSKNKNGVYEINIYIDKVLFYKFIADKLNFNTTRYINAYIDYKENKTNKIKYHKCFRYNNNKLKNYKKIINNGIINVNDSNMHHVKIEISDINGNISSVEFNFQSKIKQNNDHIIENAHNEDNKIRKKFLYAQTNIFKTNEFKLHMKKNSLYHDMIFEYEIKDSIEGIYSKIHSCHNEYVPVHEKYIISIKSKVPKRLKDKAYIAKKNRNGKFNYISEGIWENDFLRGKTRSFGDFCVLIDTIPPSINGINIYQGKNISKQHNIKCKIKDNQSGIETYRGEINGEWVLMEYDHKSNTLTYNICSKLIKGNNILNINVTDKLKNKTSYSAEFIY